MLRIYRRFWEVNWYEQWQYRANLLMYLLYWLVSPIVYLAVWTTIANSQGSLTNNNNTGGCMMGWMAAVCNNPP